jgi:hypothetical protein
VICQKVVNHPSTSNREEYRFLARESSDEDVLSTVACAVETMIDAFAVMCGVSK